MTIRAKLYAAIALTILGPLLTTVVALEGQARLGDSFDEVQRRADDAALAQEIKFDVTDTRVGGGIEWRATPSTLVAVSLMGGPGNSVLARADGAIDIPGIGSHASSRGSS